MRHSRDRTIRLEATTGKYRDVTVWRGGGGRERVVMVTYRMQLKGLNVFQSAIYSTTTSLTE
jgi:hypothetical protein